MKKMFLFMMVSLDGFMEGNNHDLSWHNADAEFIDFAMEQASDIGTIFFGKNTYQLMEGFWPSDQAAEEKETNFMINTPKVVFSTTLSEVHETEKWKNITLKHDVNPDEIKKLKKGSKKDIAVFGSNNLCITLLKLGLMDEIRIMVNPIVLGSGTRLFQGISRKLNLLLTDTRKFKNGNILLTYVPLGNSTLLV